MLEDVEEVFVMHEHLHFPEDFLWLAEHFLEGQSQSVGQRVCLCGLMLRLQVNGIVLSRGWTGRGTTRAEHVVVTLKIRNRCRTIGKKAENQVISLEK